MNERITFIGTFAIPDRDAWLAAIADMTEFVAARVPRVEAFHVYANAGWTEGTVLYVHPDADSLDQHLEAAAELIRNGTQMVEVIRIEILGEPHADTVEMLSASGTPVGVKALVRGFSR